MISKRISKKWSRLTSLITLSAMVFSFILPAGNAAKAATSPQKYYQKVENANLNKQIDTFAKEYSSYITAYQKSLTEKAGAQVVMNASFSPETAKTMGAEGLKSIKASIDSIANGKKAKAVMDIYANDAKLTSFDTYVDLDDANYYYLVPDFSKAFLKVSTKDLYGKDTASSELQNQMLDYFSHPVDADILSKALKKYLPMVTGKVTNVNMKENESVTIDNIDGKYTRLTVRINERTALNIANDILKSAKTDKSLKDALTASGLCTKTEYDNGIKKAVKEVAADLKALKKSNGPTVFTMSIWLDKNDNITGRSIIINDGKDTVKLGYKTVKKGTTIGLDAWIGEKDYDILRGTGSLSGKLLGGATGNIKISLKDSATKAPDVFNIDFKDIKYTKKGNNGFINGELDITSKLLNGVKIKVNCTNDLNRQDFICNISQSGKSLAVVSITSKEIPYTDFKFPTSADKSYDMMTQLEAYLSDGDLIGFLQKIKDRSDVKAIDDSIDSLLKASK